MPGQGAQPIRPEELVASEIVGLVDPLFAGSPA